MVKIYDETGKRLYHEIFSPKAHELVRINDEWYVITDIKYVHGILDTINVMSKDFWFKIHYLKETDKNE